MSYRIVSLGKGYSGWGSYHLGKKFTSIAEAVEYINSTKDKSSIDYDRYYSQFIVDCNNQVVAIHNCFGWQYK